MKKSMIGCTIPEIQNRLQASGFEKYRAKQVYPNLFKANVNSFDDIGNIPKKLKEFLNENYVVNEVQIHQKYISKDGSAKYLMRLSDDNLIECVLMPYKYGLSICISSQVGCLMGCRFCASTVGSLIRDLTASEMLGQILRVSQDAGEKISHVVVMGSGEPFDNFDNLGRFITLANYEDGLNLGQRHITVSTCGIKGAIRKFADLGTQVNLAVSLHSAIQEKRESIMPVAKSVSLDELSDDVKYYIDRTNRRVTYEYALIDGFNDSRHDAQELVNYVRGQLCHVNLIPLNKNEESEFDPPSKKKVNEFYEILTKNGINATIRRQIGSDIGGACGQLRAKALKKEML